LKIKIRNRVAAVVSAGVLAGGLALVPTSPAAAAVPPWQVILCSLGSDFDTKVSWSGGSLTVPRGQCRPVSFQASAPDDPGGSYSYIVHFSFTAQPLGRHISSASADVAKGWGFATSGTISNPYLYSF
jgi:hypothetical protein